jgi:chloramphenicol 3-O-phosphotransferase
MKRELVLVGAPGSGKSSVLEALTTLLEIEGTPYGAIESEQLSWGLPLLAAADWIPQLAAVIEMQRAVGRSLFLVAATPESAEELRGVVAAVAAERVLVVCLRASPDVVAARVGAREPDSWPGKQPLIAHARELARSLPAMAGIDVVIDTDERDAVSVAGEIRAALNRGLEPR